MDINTFRVSPDGLEVFMDIAIPDGPDYANLFIEKVALGTEEDVFSFSYPSVPRWEYVPLPGEQKRLVMNVPVRTIVPDPGCFVPSFFVLHVKQGGIPDPGVPCCCDREVTVRAAVHLLPLYMEAAKLFGKYVAECGKGRERLLDLYLRKNILLDMIELEQYYNAIYFFRKFLREELTWLQRGRGERLGVAGGGGCCHG
jgi:hypothetical protein